MPKVNVCGWYGHCNAGDESYKLSFPALFPRYDFSFGEGAGGRAGAVVVGGGDICYRKVLEPVVKSHKHHKHLLSVSLTSCDCPDLLAAFEHVRVRDDRSVEFLRRHGLKGSFLPDFAFAMRPDRERGRQLVRFLFEAAGAERWEKLVVVVPNGYLAGGDDKLARDEAVFHKFAYDLALIADHTKASFLFLPFGTQLPPDDRVPAFWVSSKCKWYKKNAVFPGHVPPQDALDILAAADAAVTMRLHAAIFCTVAGVPFIDITHHSKSLGYLETAGLTDHSFDYWKFDRGAAEAALHAHLKDGMGLRGKLLDYAGRCRSQLEEFAAGAKLC